MSPSAKIFFITRIIGSKNYSKLSPETKGYMLLQAAEQHRQEMIQKFGSWKAYLYNWCRRNGFESPYKYQQWLVRSWGFKSDHEYREHNAKKRGFKSRGDLFKMYAKRDGFDTLYDKYKDRYKKRGFNSQREYRIFLAERKGFKNYSQLLKYNRDIKSSLTVQIASKNQVHECKNCLSTRVDKKNKCDECGYNNE